MIVKTGRHGGLDVDRRGDRFIAWRFRITGACSVAQGRDAGARFAIRSAMAGDADVSADKIGIGSPDAWG